MSKFLIKGLSEIPGIESIVIYLDGNIYPLTEESLDLFEICKKITEASEIDKEKNNSNFDFSLLHNSDYEYLTISTLPKIYGFLILKLSNQNQFNIYKPFLLRIH